MNERKGRIKQKGNSNIGNWLKYPRATKKDFAKLEEINSELEELEEENKRIEVKYNL